jgi:C1A family cysteine protease
LQHRSIFECGYFYMPYEFITNPEYASDFWSVRKTKDLQQ